MIYQRYAHETYQFVVYLKKKNNIFRVSEKPPGQETGRSLGGTSLDGDDAEYLVGDVVRAMAIMAPKEWGVELPGWSYGWSFPSISGWWFGIVWNMNSIFPHIGDVIIPTD